MGRLPPTARHRHSDKVHIVTEEQGSLASPSFRDMRWTERLPFRFGVFVQSGPTGSGHRRRNTIFHRTLPDCDPGDRSVAGAIFCIAEIVEGGASFRAAFLPFPFARRCRLRLRRAQNEKRRAGPQGRRGKNADQKDNGRAAPSRPPQWSGRKRGFLPALLFGIDARGKFRTHARICRDTANPAPRGIGRRRERHP